MSTCYALAEPLEPRMEHIIKYTDLGDFAQGLYKEMSSGETCEWVQVEPRSINWLKCAYNGHIFGRDMIIVNDDFDWKKEKNLRTLELFLELKDNWNDNGAEPFTPSHISYVQNIIRELNPQPQIFPTAANGIHLEYDNSNGNVLIFDIKSNRKIKFFKKDNIGTVEKNIDLKTLFKEVGKFFGNER